MKLPSRPPEEAAGRLPDTLIGQYPRPEVGFERDEYIDIYINQSVPVALLENLLGGIQAILLPLKDGAGQLLDTLFDQYLRPEGDFERIESANSYQSVLVAPLANFWKVSKPPFFHWKKQQDDCWMLNQSINI